MLRLLSRGTIQPHQTLNIRRIRGGSERNLTYHLSSQHLAAAPTPNVAELVASGVFRPQPKFLRRFEHTFQGKNTRVYLDRGALSEGLL